MRQGEISIFSDRGKPIISWILWFIAKTVQLSTRICFNIFTILSINDSFLFSFANKLLVTTSKKYPLLISNCWNDWKVYHNYHRAPYWYRKYSRVFSLEIHPVKTGNIYNSYHDLYLFSGQVLNHFTWPLNNIQINAMLSTVLTAQGICRCWILL